MTPDCRRDRRTELEPRLVRQETWGAGGTLMLQQIPQAGESTLEMKGLNLARGFGAGQGLTPALQVPPLPLLQQPTFALTFLATKSCGLKSYRVEALNSRV